MEKFKNVAPMENFNWDAYENGAAETDLSKEELEKKLEDAINNEDYELASIIRDELRSRE